MFLFETMSPNDCHLQKKRIDIWAFSLNNPSAVAAYALLNAEEQARAARFHFDHHRRRFVVAHVLLRQILERYLQQSANQLRFTCNQYGKPQVVNTSALEFNLSHSRDYALLAIGQETPLGIDLEYFSTRPYQGIASHQFSKREQAQWEALPAHLKPLSFFHIWAQKEAFIKACGMGLAYPTQTFDVPEIPPTSSLIADNKHKKTWKITSFMPQLACSAALCHNPDIEQIRYLVADEKLFSGDL